MALPQKFVSEKGLPHAMRFPWDDDKGVYLLQGYHNLHCLVSLDYLDFLAYTLDPHAKPVLFVLIEDHLPIYLEC